jgi:hypothetical protein
LNLNGQDAKRGKLQFGKGQAVDTREKRLVFAVYDRFIIAASHVDDFAAGETLATRVIDRIRADKPATAQ